MKITFVANARSLEHKGLLRIHLGNCTCATCLISQSRLTLTTGRPQATKYGTIEELEAMGMVGIYSVDATV